MATNLGIKKANRAYIDKFSKAYKILYSEDTSVYLPEIFDSAQEGYSYLWVNSEKYVFSDDVLDSGRELKRAFASLKFDLENYAFQFQHKIKTNKQFREVKQSLNEYLEKFDKAWTNYEKNYILELMVIEADSRRYVQNAIMAEQELSKLENSSLDKLKLDKQTRSAQLSEARNSLVSWISQINAVANINGKGRDDLKYSILEEAEKRKSEVDAYLSANEYTHKSKWFSQLYDNLHTTLVNFRALLVKYSDNIEVVDPQLKNNVELVEAITDFENVWSKANEFFVNQDKFKCFLVMSWYLERLRDQDKHFKSQIDEMDYEIFMIIPAMIIQSAVLEIIEQNMDHYGKFDIESKPKIEVGTNFINIIATFWPTLICENSSKSEIELWSTLSNLVLSIYELYLKYKEERGTKFYKFREIFEMLILKNKLDSLVSESDLWVQKEDVDKLSSIKSMSMDLQRSKPSEWNELLDICISSA